MEATQIVAKQDVLAADDAATLGVAVAILERLGDHDSGVCDRSKSAVGIAAELVNHAALFPDEA